MKCLNCKKEYKPLNLPPSPLKTFLDYPDRLQELCPLCALEFIDQLSHFCFNRLLKEVAGDARPKERENNGHAN